MQSSNSNIIIRRIRDEKDLQSIYLIEQIAFRNPYSYELLNILATFHSEAFFIAEINGRIVGYIVSVIRRSYIGHILSIAIDPTYRRLGIASKLIEETETYFKRRNILVLRLEVRTNNLVARKFYLKLGFRDGYIIPNYYLDGESAVVMFKLLRQEK